MVGKRTLIAVPCHDMVHADFTRCLMELDKPAGTGFAMITNTLIYNARNTIAKNAVEAGFDYVLWLDSDMVFPSDTLKRLLEDMDGRDYVSGLCLSRKKNSAPCIQSDVRWWVEGNEAKTSMDVFTEYPRDSLFEVAGSGFACVMTSTVLLTKMVELYGAPFYPLMGMGEDTTFCFRARQAGFKLYCDSRVKIGHIGQRIYNEDSYIIEHEVMKKYELRREATRNIGEYKKECGDK